MRRARMACAVLLALISVSGVLAAGKVHPVVVGETSEGGVLVGGTVDSKWITAEQAAARLKGGERYKLYSETKVVGSAAGKKPSIYGMSGQREWISFGGLPDSCRMAISGDWNALPRLARNERTKQNVYLDAVRAVLASKGLGKSPAAIKQVARVDLEGDGRDEVLITAESPKYDRYVNRKGQYSFVMLRKLVAGKVKSYLLCGEFHTKDLSKESVESIQYSPEYYEIAGFWDVDGDGALEIAVDDACVRTDGVLTTIYDLDGGRVRTLGKAGFAV
jgi:hypothetical protein